jgi:hypothetical protein
MEGQYWLAANFNFWRHFPPAARVYSGLNSSRVTINQQNSSIMGGAPKFPFAANKGSQMQF